MEPLQQESDSCSEEVRPAFYIRLFCVSWILLTSLIVSAGMPFYLT
jgi:hypothetical protein